MTTRALITTDCHLAPPPALADELPERLRAQVTHLEKRNDGVYLVRPQLIAAMEAMSDSASVPAGGDNVTAALARGLKVDPDDEASLARLLAADVRAEANPGFTAKSFIDELARDGVVGAVLIGGAAFGIHADTEVDIAWTRLVNDWTAQTFAGELHRFAPGINLPLGDIAAAVKELERAAGLGLRPALLPDVIPAKPYTLPEWEPLWEAAESLGIPLATHVGSARAMYPWSGMTAYSPGQGATTAFALVSLGMAETVAWFAAGGILERHPNLKVVMTECSAGWLAWLMNFLDHHYAGPFGNAFLTEQGFTPMKATEAPPSYYIKRQVSCTFMDDPVAIHNREFTGLDSLMWGNDYPHQEGIFPDSQEWVNKQFAGVPEAEIQQIVHDNAAKVFGLTV
jgi:predicted TIM-barrel fold metal-dependent hydrolase